MSAFDVLIVGSGPAGTAAAFPLVAAGLRVGLLEGGTEPPAAPPSLDDFMTLRRRDPEQWRYFLGKDLSALRPLPVASPKFRVPGLQAVFDRYAQACPVEGRGFHTVGALAPGGLSRAWGAGVACFDDDDLGDAPLSAADLAPSYRRVAERISIAGDCGDRMADFFGTELPLQAPCPLSDNARILLERHARAPERAARHGIRLGHARNAVLTTPLGGRQGCRRCGLCLWGCPSRSIYSAAYDLEDLAATGRATLLTGRLVTAVRSTAEGVTVEARHGDAVETFTARRVLLAAGAVNTARLVLSALGHVERPVRLQSTPTAGFAAWLPERLGQVPAAESFSLAQLSYRVELEGGEPAFGNLFAADGLPVHEFVRLAPLSPMAGARVFSRLLPSLLVGNCFLPGSFSRHTLSLGGDGRVVIEGGLSPEAERAVRRIRRTVSRAFLSYGVVILPGGFRVGAPGTDIHYAGTVPMRAEPRPHEAGADGEVAGLPGVHVVDAAALARLPAKAHTLTVMANADRIAGLTAARLGAS